MLILDGNNININNNDYNKMLNKMYVGSYKKEILIWNHVGLVVWSIDINTTHLLNFSCTFELRRVR